jgi:hypothetical protein
MVIPDILLILMFNDKKNNFHIKKIDTELKGYLYPINPWKELEHRVDYLLDKIKSKNKNSNKIVDENEISNAISKDYENIIGDIKKKFPNPVSIFYKISLHTFLRNTFKYYRIYITSDLIRSNQINSKDNSLSNLDEDENFSRLNWRAATLTIDKKEIKKMKEIKLSVDSVKGQNEENKDDELIDDEKKENKDDESGREENKKNRNEDNNKSFNMGMVGSGRQRKKSMNALEIASADEAKYNRLKKNIVDNQETFIIFYMKLLNLVFALLTIFFIIYDSIINKKNMVNLDKFLNENLIFNHSKISAGMLYVESNLYKYLRDGYLNASACLNESCEDSYLSQIIFCIDDMKNLQDKFSTLSRDFVQKINIVEEITIENKNSSELIEVNMEFMMNLLINFSLRLREASKQLKEKNTDEEYSIKMDIALKNLIEQSDKLETLNINGFSGKNKIDKINNLFNPFPISLVIMVIFIVIFVGGFFYFIYYLYTYEVFFIEKLIDFNNPKYEAYLKQLEELKKKLRNENEDEDDEDKEDDLGFGTGMGTKNNEESHKKMKDKDKNDEDKKDKEDQKMQKRIRGKEKSKLQHQQKKKKTIMKNFFLKINIFFCIKIFALAFLALTYYIFSTVIKSDTRTNYLQVESITDETEGIYKESLDIHLMLLRKVKIIIDYVNEKEEAKKTGNTVNFPKITIPSIDEIEFPKLGNLLMPIVSSSGDEAAIASQFNELYNRDACQFLFHDHKDKYEECITFWNGVIAKGMEQSLTQMSVSITSVIDDLKNLNNETVTREDMIKFLDEESYFYQFQIFMEYYFYLSYLKTAEMFNILRKGKIESIKNKFDILLILYLIVSILLFVLVLLFIYSIKSYFNSFLNFVAIFPLRFISEDENLFRNILKLDESLFH